MKTYHRIFIGTVHEIYEYGAICGYQKPTTEVQTILLKVPLVGHWGCCENRREESTCVCPQPNNLLFFLLVAVAWHPIHETLFASGGSDGAILFWDVGLGLYTWCCENSLKLSPTF